MRRLAPLLLLWALVARGARADEAPSSPAAPAAPPPKQGETQEEATDDAEDVAKALLSPQAAEQRRGEAALTAALRGAPARAAEFVRRLGQALRARLAPDAPADAERQREAPPGPPASEPPPAPTPARVTPHSAPQPPAGGTGDPLADPPLPAQQEAAPPEPATPAAGASAPAAQTAESAKEAAWDLKLWAVSVAAREVEGLVPTDRGPASPIRGAKGTDGSRTVQGPSEWAPAWAQTALRSADATPIAERVLRLRDGESTREVLGRELRYRRAALQTKGGAWAVETDALHPGLSVTASAQGASLALEVAWVEVAQPMARERVRPAANVEPIELDRPDWSVARRRETLAFEAQGTAALLVLPGLLPDPERRLVLVVSLLKR
jgi:hypothetical protein